MKKMMITAVAAILLAGFSSAPVFAGAQQEKMKTCNKEAREKALKGDDRKKFMKECLSAAKPAADQPIATSSPAAAPAAAASGTEPDGKKTQQNKMKDCNKAAKEKNLKGDERKSFMSECLKG